MTPFWGLFPTDKQSPTVWNSLQTSLSKYGSKLDIVYQDPKYSATGKYPHVFKWNQNG